MYDILIQNLEYFKSVWSIKRRKAYIDRLKRFVETGNITVVTWVRRSWKSTIILDYLNIESKESVFYFSKELDPDDKITDNIVLRKLFDVYVKKFGNPTYIVIDEIQDIKDWEKFLRYVFALKKYKIIISWSNSNLLSSELSTYLAWRYFEVKVFPLSYSEFLIFKDVEHTDDVFNEYLVYWWLPESVLFDDFRLKRNYIEIIKDSIILKDIVSRYKIKDIWLFMILLRYIADNIWQFLSGRNIHKYLKNQWVNIALSTLLDYIYYSEIAFITNKVNRFDIKWKKILEINNKYYFWDLWVRNGVLWKFSSKDIWQLLENFVYNQLMQASYDVYIWNLWEYEIDFVAQKNGNIKYFQVSYVMNDETYTREVWNLNKIRDNYEKFVVTLDKYRLWDDNGIKIIWIEEFCNMI